MLPCRELWGRMRAFNALENAGRKEALALNRLFSKGFRRVRQKIAETSRYPRRYVSALLSRSDTKIEKEILSRLIKIIVSVQLH